MYNVDNRSAVLKNAAGFAKRDAYIYIYIYIWSCNKMAGGCVYSPLSSVSTTIKYVSSCSAWHMHNAAFQRSCR